MSNNNILKTSLPILLYDSECSLCRRFKTALENISNNEIQIISIHNEDIYKSFPSLNPVECNKEIHLIIDHENILKGKDTINYLIKLFPGVKKFSWLIESNMGKKTTDLFYNFINKRRAVLHNRCSNCNK